MKKAPTTAAQKATPVVQIDLRKDDYRLPWWETKVFEQHRNDSPPWGEWNLVDLKELGPLQITLTRNMLGEYSKTPPKRPWSGKMSDPIPANPEGRGLRRSFEEYAALAATSIAGIRAPLNPLDLHDSRKVKHAVERILTSLSLGLLIKLEWGDDPDSPPQMTYGHEVRYLSDELQELCVRTLAGMGFICHVMPDNAPTAIWNTATMGKFFGFPLSLCGTASHSNSLVDGLKIMDHEGSQFLVERVTKMVEIQRAILNYLKRHGSLTITLAAKDDPRLSDQLYRLTHHGMAVYEEYQRQTAADEWMLERVNRLNPTGIHIDCCHGAGRASLGAFFRRLGLSRLTERLDWHHVEERADFGNIGKANEHPAKGHSELYDMGADVTQVMERELTEDKRVPYFPVLRTADYPEWLTSLPVGDIILHTDMDNDRLAASQIVANTAANRKRLQELGVLFNVLSRRKLQAVFVPNKFFHLLQEMNFRRLLALCDQGVIPAGTVFLVLKTVASTPAVDQWAERCRAEAQQRGCEVAVVNTAVGFAKLANVMYKLEYLLDQGKPARVRDALGKEVEVGDKPLILAAWEESGGIIVGIVHGYTDLEGKPFLAQREKSATESIFLSLALIADLQERGKADLTACLAELYERDGIEWPIDLRFDNALVKAEDPPEKQAEANRRKNRIFGAYLSVAFQYQEDEGFTLDQARTVLTDLMHEEAAYRTGSRCRKAARLEGVEARRLREVDFGLCQDLRFTGDGVLFVFRQGEAQWWVLFRPSGTDPKLKAYGFGAEAQVVTDYTWAFAFNENWKGEDSKKPALPKSFRNHEGLKKQWGDDGTRAVKKAANMQLAWEECGELADLSPAERKRKAKQVLDRSVKPIPNHLAKVAAWVNDDSRRLGRLEIDLSSPPAADPKTIDRLLKEVKQHLAACAESQAGA